MRIMLILMLIITFILPAFPSLGNEPVGNNCTKETNTTMKCNYIPKDIPDGITKIQITISGPHGTSVAIHQDNFSSVTWSRVRYLDLGDQWKVSYAGWDLLDECFIRLNMLQELKISIWYYFYLFPNTFLGLNSVRTLDMSGCVRGSMKQLAPALNGSNKLPGLNRLILSNVDTLRGPYAFDNTFVQILLPRNITSIDISNCQISELNATSIFKNLNDLQVFNVSYSTISDIEHNPDILHKDVKQVKIVDGAHAVLPKNAIPRAGKYVFANMTVNVPDAGAVFMIDTLNISNIINELTSFWIENYTVIMDTDVNYYTKNLIMQHNNVKRLNVRFICDKYKLSAFRYWDISDNGLEFLHPTILSCMSNLQRIELSGNNLHKMVREDINLFENLFSRLQYLKFVGLSRNELSNIPSEIFENAKNLEIIDLSNNKLQQVTFTLNDLDNLQVLDLHGNDIHILDSTSIDHLNSIPQVNNNRRPTSTVILKDNPISCSECNAKYFLQFLLSTKLIDMDSQNMKCFTENGKPHNINNSAVKIVQEICNRKTILISISVSMGVVCILIVAFVIFFYKRNKRARKIQNRATVINRLQEGEGRYKFVTFLAYSNDDEECVARHILNPLNENLQLMTGIDRLLVSWGDRDLRAGFYVHNETYRCFDTVCVLTVVASNNFCNSQYCLNELDQAYVKGMPIVLMFIEHVDEDLMTPTMKELYQRNVRILWEMEDGEYILKTTWENVCTSILDLIQGVK